ncbi:SGNH/GDSL hydrolase family protein [Bifidobacterium pseudolongum]|uniref:SGNH/GDSL hydrolase family protein n=1 Tax=Bifidobacterium pseudolongum TaxID=1694 RepID=UPI00101ED877|nr:SGNH/GDSL hydrolase family protein [Bifidobacterium pseudolongum]RYQ74619.1 hypothetical protein PG2012B_0437 [Bifidobacterium pseudolongum subsp. globosum]
MGAYAGVATNLLRSGARAGSIIVWIGGPVTNGGGASTGSKRMSSIASRDLGLTEKNYAAASVTVSNGLVTRCYAARDDTSYDHAQVAYVVLAGGLEDPISALATVIAKARDAINECRKAFPRARIVWAAGPGCITGATIEARNDQTTVINAITSTARRMDALTLDLRSVCGTDRTLQSSGILPNDEGHARLAEAIVDAIRDDQGEPVDQPITPTRTYSSGLNDWASRQVEATRRREAEKREANRPTGTELGGVTQKLDELTQAQGVQQVLLEQQQDELDEHQQELEAQQQKLTQHQSELEAQQKSLKSAQDAIKQAQEQLAKIVGDQGDQVNTLKTLTESLQKTDEKIDTIQRTLWENQQKLDNRIDKLDERVQKLENGTSA